MITLFAPDGIGEVGPGTDLAAEIVAAVAADPAGPLHTGDIVVVTSKVVSKAEARYVAADRRDEAIDAETVRTVARRGDTRIVRTRSGLTLAAAGVDNSNVAPEHILLLPVDPDASAARLRRDLEALTGTRLGVLLSDTAGRAWRIGQTDQAIGASGLRVVERYEGRRDDYGNDLHVTAVAVADELAAAADLVKAKLSQRPVAVIRGLSEALVDDQLTAETRAADLVREEATDMFRYGSREAVLAAVLAATGQGERYEELLRFSSAGSMADAAVAGADLSGGEAEMLRRVLTASWRA